MNSAVPLLPPGFARHWARELDCKEASLVRLNGGINNRVYRCGEEGSHQWVIKGYAPLEPGARDRMQAEVDFLRYAPQVAPGFTPELIHVDTERRCVVLENLSGQPFREGIPPPREAVKAAIVFFTKLNSELDVCRTLYHQNAVEGFLSIHEHLDNLLWRAHQMQSDHLEGELKMHSEKILKDLNTQIKKTDADIRTKIDTGCISNTIEPHERFISPSDFGFHNAIITSRGIKFYDFEFAGWDDPAKAILDFTLQPHVPVRESESLFIKAMPANLQKNTANRCTILKPIIRLKWLCIILGVLRPERLKEMANLYPNMDVTHIITQRLRAAQIRIASLNHNINYEYPQFIQPSYLLLH